MILNGILHTYRSVPSSSGKLLAAAAGNKYRDSRPENMQRMRGSGPETNFLSNPFPRGTGRDVERLREPERMEATKKTRPSQSTDSKLIRTHRD